MFNVQNTVGIDKTLARPLRPTRHTDQSITRQGGIINSLAKQVFWAE